MIFDYWMPHRPKKSMFSKRAVIVSTAAGTSTKHAMKDVEDSLFNMMGMMQKNGWGSSPVEKEYWEQNGWLAKDRPWK